MERRKKNIAELTRISRAEYRAINKLPLVVVADNVRSMHNIGSLFRTSDAFRVSEIILCGISGCPPHPEISKTALGAEESVSWKHAEDTLNAVTELRNQGWKICVLEQTHGSIPLADFNLTQDSGSDSGVEVNVNNRLVLVVGNEVNGVGQEIVDIADYVLEIPQEGTKHSLNVAASAAIAIFHLYTLLKSIED
ncbi:MAG: RNA methyltransferase [Bacteroidales bacterium]|nr:RNA methyltransferase [Bacteroidales bacterium]MBD5205206.1 RNA methyltransferase [Bacteroidales bacterium]MBD5224155.1 RNA methyltransferase [Bacteroidales bacterium]MBD5302807.1 RNA methyltransferase [Bacteroides sp.]